MILQRDDGSHIHLRVSFWREVLSTARRDGWVPTSARWSKAKTMGGTLTVRDAMGLGTLLATAPRRYHFISRFLASGGRVRIYIDL